MDTTDKTYSLDDLCSLLEINKRTVRFYMQHELVDRPEGLNRGAYYTQKHLDQLLEIKKWQRAGLSLERIKEIIAEQRGDVSVPLPLASRPGDIAVWSRLTVGPGIELNLEPQQAGLTPEQAKVLFRLVMEAYNSVKEKV